MTWPASALSSKAKRRELKKDLWVSLLVVASTGTRGHAALNVLFLDIANWTLRARTRNSISMLVAHRATNALFYHGLEVLRAWWRANHDLLCASKRKEELARACSGAGTIVKLLRPSDPSYSFNEQGFCREGRAVGGEPGGRSHTLTSEPGESVKPSHVQRAWSNRNTSSSPRLARRPRAWLLSQGTHTGALSRDLGIEGDAAPSGTSRHKTRERVWRRVAGVGSQGSSGGAQGQSSEYP